MSRLPIEEVLPDVLEIFRSQNNCILHAPPGAGKTTRVPLELLKIVTTGRIIMLEPRRLAAVSAARWMARSRVEEVGQTVGYSIRFDSKTTPNTRIEVVTEAILTRRIQNDPLLEDVALVIFDEFHERSIHADLGLALCLDIQRQVRPDLKILVMSATLECAPLSGLMGGAPIISSAGRSFPVAEIYLDDRSHASLPARMTAATLQILAETEGDLLVFLPGSGEIRSCNSGLTDAGLPGRGIGIHPLYGDLPFEQQQAAIQPGTGRKVVLATSIAETSLTIEGVRTVLDCGLSRRMRHDPASGMNRLVTVRESRSSAEQRKGRAGRLAPGTCYRLFSQHTYNAMTAQTPPEILDSDLSPLLLELSAWGINDPQDLPWLDPPPISALNVARQLLQSLTALDHKGHVTALGSAMARLPLHPRLARMVIRAQELSCPDLGCDLATLLSERDIVHRTNAGKHRDTRSHTLSERLEALQKWRSYGQSDPLFDRGALQNCVRVSQQLRRLISTRSNVSEVSENSDLIGCLLLASYPDRVAYQREASSLLYLLANGRGARMSKSISVTSVPWIVAVSVDGGEQGEGIIHLAEPVSERLVRRELQRSFERREIISWDSREGRVVAQREECLGALCVSSQVFIPAREKLLPVMIEAVRSSRLSLLNRNESFLQFQARVMLLRKAYPSDGWPDLSDMSLLETADEWLAPWLQGVRNANQLSAINLTENLLSRFDYRQRQALDELAPTHLNVPSGSRIRLDYCEGEQPVLAVKLQELFGLADTPRVAGGRVAVLLHLLSPAGRPLQVTQDLKGFWDGSYHVVKKEMKGRYPKHSWPDDPWNAPPTRRAKPRGT
jgi:ATP-dependent helicase HrpB